MRTPSGEDLVKRLISTEAKYMMEGMKDLTIEGKGIALAKMGAIYDIRTMLTDLSKPVSSQSSRSAGSE